MNRKRRAKFNNLLKNRRPLETDKQHSLLIPVAGESDIRENPKSTKSGIGEDGSANRKQNLQNYQVVGRG